MGGKKGWLMIGWLADGKGSSPLMNWVYYITTTWQCVCVCILISGHSTRQIYLGGVNIHWDTGSEFGGRAGVFVFGA